MTDITAVIRGEIHRLIKQDSKAKTSATKRAIAQLRSDSALLKRHVQKLQKEIDFLRVKESKILGQPQGKEDERLEGVRHSARSVRSQRKRLRLSAADFGKLVGVSGLTVYNWEHGKGRPQKERLLALLAVREMSRQEALAKLDSVKADTRMSQKEVGQQSRVCSHTEYPHSSTILRRAARTGTRLPESTGGQTTAGGFDLLTLGLVGQRPS